MGAPGAAEPTDCVILPAITRPIGYGAATTGGGNASAVLANSFEAAQAALDAYRHAFDDGAQTSLVLQHTGCVKQIVFAHAGVIR